jgi:hypothetical protein
VVDTPVVAGPALLDDAVLELLGPAATLDPALAPGPLTAGDSLFPQASGSNPATKTARRNRTSRG